MSDPEEDRSQCQGMFLCYYALTIFYLLLIAINIANPMIP